MSIKIPTNPVEIAEVAIDQAEKFSGNDRKMFIGVTIMFLLTIIYIYWQASSDIKQQRSEFLQQIERNTERMMNSFDKNTEALRSFQEAQRTR